MKLLETLLELNKQLCIDGFECDFTIQLSHRDFHRFARLFEREHKHLITYPELNTSSITRMQIAGPGSYFQIECKDAEI